MDQNRRAFLKAALPLLAGVVAGCDKSTDTGQKADLNPPPPTPLKPREAPKAGR